MLWFRAILCNTILCIGYARVSTDGQNLNIQIHEWREAGRDRIFPEKLSAANRQRPELASMLEQFRKDDVIIVWKLDRLARSTRALLLELADAISKAGAGLTSLSEPWADTTSPAGRMVLPVFAGIAECERELIRERTGTGKIAAMKREVRFGRPARLTTEQAALARRLHGSSGGKAAIHRGGLIAYGGLL
jgi:DNA invertase Pin-like site-specific DNA recombinase